MDQDVVLSVSDLNLYYKNRKKKLFEKNSKKQVLFDFSFDMKEGEVLGIA